jgi:cellulose synthase/poly-beta-1,6-N-acetylglucosamine synthase-like glycosyltransferase
MIFLSIALGLIAAGLLLPTVSDLVSLLRILAPRRPRNLCVVPEHPRLLLLVPAHDEELLLARCLESLKRQRYPRERLDIVVIADNCRDRTAEIARAAGVRCLERHAPTDPGKPQAIAWALSQLRMRPYEATVIVDADTEVNANFAAHLAAAAPLSHKALQPYNGPSNGPENSLTRMAAVLSAANHGLAYVLKTRVGLNVPLSAGMCIGSRILADHGWTAYSLSEDWELYALLTTRGIRIEGVPDARIHALEAATLQASASQRRRWTAERSPAHHYAWPCSAPAHRRGKKRQPG